VAEFRSLEACSQARQQFGDAMQHPAVGMSTAERSRVQRCGAELPARFRGDLFVGALASYEGMMKNGHTHPLAPRPALPPSTLPGYSEQEPEPADEEHPGEGAGDQ